VVNLLHYDLIQSDFVGMKMAASARAPPSPKKRRLVMLLVLDCENGHYLAHNGYRSQEGIFLLRFEHDFDAAIFFLAENFVPVWRIRQRQSVRDNIVEADLFLIQ
jgi:hypothetical protein